MKRVLSDGEVVPCPILSSWAATHTLEWLQRSKSSHHPYVMDEMELGRTWSTPSRVGSAKMAMGSSDNRHLSCPAESISVNMGDLPRDDKESGSTGGETPLNPPRPWGRVSVAIVLGGRESRPQGEGPQLMRCLNV